MPAPPSQSCPRCKRLLPPAGEAVVTHEDGAQEAVILYQCDECLVSRPVFGEVMEMALTFAVDEDGSPFDPADPDNLLPWG